MFSGSDGKQKLDWNALHLHLLIRPNKIEITVLRPARICFEVAALSILSKFQ